MFHTERWWNTYKLTVVIVSGRQDLLSDTNAFSLTWIGRRKFQNGYRGKLWNVWPSYFKCFSRITQKANYSNGWELLELLETFSIRFFMGNCKLQTAQCHVTTALWSRLQFAVHVWTAERASSSKWFTARFFATKNWTALRLKVIYRFSHG